MAKICVVIGTRPEAIKMAPLVKALKEFKSGSHFQVSLCVTGQHRSMLDQVLNFFDLKPDYDLNVMKSGQSLTDVTARIIQGLEPVLRELSPDLVLVHGDTTTTMAASIAALYARLPLGHIEAGLRTGNKYSPWPEEVNRRITSVLADFHFSPTVEARGNLISEGVRAESIFVTGNTVIDALRLAVLRIDSDKELKERLGARFSYLHSEKKLVLVTGHRRENFGDGFLQICNALRAISERDDCEVVYPVHLNPNVRKPVEEILSGTHNVHLIEPLEYMDFVYLMGRSYLILTDSGGIQEEAPSLGKPVLVMRETTERPEGVSAGTVRLVGASELSIVSNSVDLLSNKDSYEKMSRAINPYGDGLACGRIVEAICGLGF